MATSKTTSKATATSSQLSYPENVGVLGVLSFPLWGPKDLDKLTKWRQEKGHKPGKFPDRIGGELFIKQNQLDSLKKYLTEIFIPFAIQQYAATNGSKGWDQAAADEILEQLKEDNWEDANLPIRELSEKDDANLEELFGEDHGFVAGFSFSGSGGNAIQKKALAVEGENRIVVTLDDLVENGVEIGDRDRLWWGSRNFFRGAFNLNAYTREVKKNVTVYGISAYTRALYLRSDLPMSFGGGSDDDVVLEDDYED